MVWADPGIVRDLSYPPAELDIFRQMTFNSTCNVYFHGLCFVTVYQFVSCQASLNWYYGIIISVGRLQGFKKPLQKNTL